MNDDAPHDDATRDERNPPDDPDPTDGQGVTCDRCGEEAVPARSGAVSILECAECGNVLGLDDVAFDQDVVEAERPASTDEIVATDGELGQLVTLLRAEDTADDGSGPSLSTDRLLLSTDSATLEVRASGDEVEIRALDRGGD